MGCENIQSFTIPGALFAQILWGGGGGVGGCGRGGRIFCFLNFGSFSCNLLTEARNCSQRKENVSLNAEVS